MTTYHVLALVSSSSCSSDANNRCHVEILPFLSCSQMSARRNLGGRCCSSSWQSNVAGCLGRFLLRCLFAARAMLVILGSDEHVAASDTVWATTFSATAPADANMFREAICFACSQINPCVLRNCYCMSSTHENLSKVSATFQTKCKQYFSVKLQTQTD